MGIVRLIPLGGSGEIGKNCTVVEQDDDMIIVDCGISFPHEEHHGVDIVIPDFTYILENRDKLRGIILTHAHEDHVGALSFLLKEVNVPLYASPLTEALVRSKLEERVHLKDIEFKPLPAGKPFKIGPFTIEPVRVTHSIPETHAISITTEHGRILFTADFKFDMNPVDRIQSDFNRLTEMGDEGVLLLVSDSTNVDQKGWSRSESEVESGLESIFKNAEGRVLVTTFSSQIHRMQQVVNAAKATGRYVSVCGRRMDQVFQMCRNMKYLSVPDDIYVPNEDLNKYKHDEIVVLVTGSQGEQMAALSQMSRGEYSRMKVVQGDTIVYSARAIPGNEGGIWRTINRLFKLGADVITDYGTPIHVSGHGYEDEIRLMYQMTKPFYVAPVHGEPRHQIHFSRLLDDLGHPGHRKFILANGDVLQIDEQKAWIADKVQAGDVWIDQHGNAVVTDSCLRQRTALANDGIFIISALIDTDDQCFVGKPTSYSSGFVGDNDAIEDIMDDLIKGCSRFKTEAFSSAEAIKNELEKAARRFIYHRTSQKPVVIAVVQTV
ncbi:MAG: ribonuclease J [Armatimonadetes bacterium]|nr:ribonuclease J [Armatimonadota bacterium]